MVRIIALSATLALSACTISEKTLYTFNSGVGETTVPMDVQGLNWYRSPEPNSAWIPIKPGDSLYRESAELVHRFASLQADADQLAALPYPVRADQFSELVLGLSHNEEIYCGGWRAAPSPDNTPPIQGLLCFHDAQRDGKFEAQIFRPDKQGIPEHRRSIEPLAYVVEDRPDHVTTWINRVIRVAAVEQDHVLLALHSGATTTTTATRPPAEIDQLPRHTLFGIQCCGPAQTARVQWGGALMDFRKDGDRILARVVQGFTPWATIESQRNQILAPPLAPPSVQTLMDGEPR